MTAPEDTAGNNGKWPRNLNDIINLRALLFEEYEKRRQTPPPSSIADEGMDTIDRDKLILEELRKNYDRDIDLRKHTEGKTNTIITFAGVILTLLLAFIALYFDKIMLAISAIVLSLVLSILSVTARRNLDTASTIGIFTTDDHHVNWPGILNWRDNDTPMVDHQPMNPLKKYINIYTDAIWRNSKQRETKPCLKWSQISLMVGIGLIGVVIGLTIFLGDPRVPGS